MSVSWFSQLPPLHVYDAHVHRPMDRLINTLRQFRIMFYMPCDKLTIVRFDNKLKIKRKHELFEMSPLPESTASLLAKPIYLPKLLLTQFTLLNSAVSQYQAPLPKTKPKKTFNNKKELANGQMLDF